VENEGAATAARVKHPLFQWTDSAMIASASQSGV
jgi:hypothetical protein